MGLTALTDMLDISEKLTDRNIVKYVKLLNIQRKNGRIQKSEMAEFNPDLELLSLFEVDNFGMYYNIEMEYEIVKAKRYSTSRRKNRTGVVSSPKKSEVVKEGVMARIELVECENVLKNQIHMIEKTAYDRGILTNFNDSGGFSEVRGEKIKHNALLNTALYTNINKEIKKENNKRKKKEMGTTKVEGAKIKEEKPSWKLNFNIYLESCKKGFREYFADKELLKRQQSYYPHKNIEKIMEAAYLDFWATEAGWQNKKRKQIKDIDWKRTITNSIKMGNIYYTKEELARQNRRG